MWSISKSVSICDQRKSQVHHFSIGFQKPGICADSWFLESNGKMVHLGFSLIKNRAPHGLGFLCPLGYTFYSRSCAWTYKFWLAQVGWLYSGWIVSLWRHGNWTRGARFLIRENPNCTILPLDPRNQESVQIGTDSWFLESNGKMVQLGLSLHRFLVSGIQW